jgi:hypothetical protein
MAQVYIKRPLLRSGKRWKEGEFAEEVGFEPTNPIKGPVFETGAIGHYATPPSIEKQFKS